MSQKRHLTTANEVTHIVQDLKTMDDVTMKSFYGIERATCDGQFYDYSEDKIYESAEEFANWFVDLEEADGGYDDPQESGHDMDGGDYY